MNIRLLIEYDGSQYCGWQRQKTGPSIQATIEDILGKVHGGRTVLYGAGRTDSGVHARGQVACFFSQSNLPVSKWRDVLNDHLPEDIRILESECVDDNFHPQKHAVAKEYEYCIVNRRYKSALNRRAYFIPRPLNWTAIEQALPALVGTHDFSSFQGAKADVESTVRTVTHLHLVRQGGGWYSLRVRGNGFLKQMVRTMVGTLVEVGLGKRGPDTMAEILLARDRRAAGHTAPACGLTLVRVFYPEE